jgi:hypothetical protein
MQPYSQIQVLLGSHRLSFFSSSNNFNSVISFGIYQDISRQYA